MTMLLAIALIASGTWEQIDVAEGVTVSTRATPGSKYVSMRGEGVVDAPIAQVATVLLDDARLPEWVDDVEARVVEVLGPTEYIEYNHVKMPPLITDREFITNVSMAVDPLAHTALIVSEPAESPKVRKGNRIRGELHGSYEMRALGADKTHVVIVVTTDPKGWLPAWLVNYFQKDWALATIRGIRKQSAKGNLKVPRDFALFVAQLDFATDLAAR